MVWIIKDIWLHFKGMKVGKLQGTIFDYLDNIRSSRSLCIGPTQAERTFLLMSPRHSFLHARQENSPALDTYFHWRYIVRLPIRNQNRLEISKVVWDKVWAVQVRLNFAVCISFKSGQLSTAFIISITTLTFNFSR